MPREAEEAQGGTEQSPRARARSRLPLPDPLLLCLPRSKAFHCHQRDGRGENIGHGGAGHGEKRRNGHKKQSASSCVPPVPSKPKDQRSHRHNCNPDQHQLRDVGRPLMGARQDCRHERISHQCISWRQCVGFRAILDGVPADVEIHRVHGVLDDLLRHCEEMRIVDKESLVQVREKANRGKK